MKYVLIILLSLPLYATNWYVDRDATGLNNGTSWANAWEYVGGDGTPGTGIDWSVIGSGDTIYISGGTDSTLYTSYSSGWGHHIGIPLSTDTLIYSPPVVITNSTEANHNGIPVLGYFDDIGQPSLQSIFTIEETMNGIKVRGLQFTDSRTYGAPNTLISVLGDNNVVDSCTVLATGLAPFFGITGTNNTVSNCYIYDPPNERTQGQDFFGISAGNGGHTITNNLVIVNNNYTMVSGDSANVTKTDTSFTDSDLPAMEIDYHTPGITLHYGDEIMVIDSNSATTFYGSGWTASTSYSDLDWYMEGSHRDGVQYNLQYADGGIDYADTLTETLANNIFIDRGTRGTGWNALLYSPSGGSHRIFHVYNNIMVNKEELSSGGIFMYEAYDTLVGGVIQPFSTIVFANNTIITKGDGHYYADESPDGVYYNTGSLISLEDFDSLVVLNNMMVCDTTVQVPLNFSIDKHPVDAPWKYDPNNYIWVDHNVYAMDAYNVELFAVDIDTFYSTYRTLVTWRQQLNTNSTNRDANSLVGTPDTILFVNKYDTTAASYMTTTGRGAGVDLTAEYPFLQYDILGVDRSTSWDIGAVQYQAPAVSGATKPRRIIIQ